MRIKLSRVIAVSLFALASSASIAYAWTAPTVAPTGGNVSEPINTSATDQTKEGGLTASTLNATAFSTYQVNASQIGVLSYEYDLQSYDAIQGSQVIKCTCDTGTSDECPAATFEATNLGTFCYDNTTSSKGVKYYYTYKLVSSNPGMTGGLGFFDNGVTIGNNNAPGFIPSLKFITDTFTSKITNDAGTLKFLDNSNTAKFSFKQDGSFCFGDGSDTTKCKSSWGASDQWTTSGANVYSTLAGNVGIGTGTATPSAKLEVNGDVNTNSGVSLTSSSALTFYPGVKSASIVPNYTTPELTDTCGTANSDTDGSGTVVNKEDGVVCTGSNAVSKCIDTAHQYVGGIDNGYASREITCVATAGTYAIKNNNNSLNFVNGTGASKLTLDQNGLLSFDLTGGTSNTSAAVNAIFIKAGTHADNKGTILVNKPNIQFWNDTDAVGANLLAKGATFTGTVEAPSLKLTGGTLASGKVLTSDANGNATWGDLPASASSMPAGKLDGDTLRYDGAKWATSTALTNDGTDISVTGNFNSPNSKGLFAKNAAGTLEQWMWPRWSDDTMYTNFGTGGWNIRNNSKVSSMFLSNNGTVNVSPDGVASSAVLGVKGNFQVEDSVKGSLIVAIPGTSYATLKDAATHFNVGDSIKVVTTSNGYITGDIASFTGDQINFTNATNSLFGSNGTYAATFYKDTDLFKLTTSTGNNKLTVDKSGNVGIGTGTPGAKLDVAGSTKLAGPVTLTDAGYFLGAPSYGFRFNDNASAYNNFIIYENGDTYTRGNVGIGTTPASDRKLDVGGYGRFGSATGGNVTVGNDGNAQIELRQNNGTGVPYIDFTNDSSTDYDMRLILDSNDSMHINGGNVGIGENADVSQKLTVDGNINKSSSWILGDADWGANTLEVHSNGWDGVSGGSYGGIAAGKIYAYGGLQSGGNSGNEAAAGELYVAGKSTLTGNTTVGGTLGVTSDVIALSFSNSSDLNLKKNILPLSGQLEKISQLQGVSFDWKKDDKHNLGLIAQEVEKVYPDLVSTDKTTGLKSVAYGNLVAPLIEAVKELKMENNLLMMRLEKLENK